MYSDNCEWRAQLHYCHLNYLDDSAHRTIPETKPSYNARPGPVISTSNAPQSASPAITLDCIQLRSPDPPFVNRNTYPRDSHRLLEVLRAVNLIRTRVAPVRTVSRPLEAAESHRNTTMRALTASRAPLASRAQSENPKCVNIDITYGRKMRKPKGRVAAPVPWCYESGE